ncbi:hypothetical protein BZG36_02114 [Bifiguratus adelaidae]|uniref:Band 7 domain-containing protein n=1 Tax=Bifiguratus adelaidae TaxID=1938954 RepID=A0A261Y2Z9_9FUNG|nr:hypothetical protein BZG36_02114 [Bifiguratus adelaidae]
MKGIQWLNSVNALALQRRVLLKSSPVVIRRLASYGYSNDFGDQQYANNWGSWASGVPSGSPQRRPLPRNTVIKFVPEKEAWIVERMGRFNRMLEPGLNFLVPFLDRVKYVKSLKEVAVEVPTQSAITQDNVTLELDGVLYYKVVDPLKASYGVENAEFAVTQLAQTTMRAEIGQMSLDRTLAERAHLNANIVDAINTAAEDWGIRCLRYEIRDIHPPNRVVESMHQQVSAERTKRAQILESEGARQAAINVAEGKKQATILASEAEKAEQINQAGGEAEAILLRAKATASSIRQIAESIQHRRGNDAVSLTIAEKYVDAFAQLAKESTTLIVPAEAGNAGGMVAQALSIYDTISNKRQAASRHHFDSSSVSPSASIKEEMEKDLVDAQKIAEEKNSKINAPQEELK